ncbi:MAG TPA: outer membrane lipoprotein-sorting protein [Treponemataceae bacterium]|nr:outer membrane lipoprotein-sorting protein [Treponemataceae bacterium]
MKGRIAIALAALALISQIALAEDADAIVRASRDRIDAKTVSSRSRMVIAAKNGTTTERLLDQYSADSDDGTKTLIVFQKPAGIAGTRFLTIGKKSAGDDRWIYLPALGKVRRIAASEGSGSFMGTDMSYDDISSANRESGQDSHRLLREENLSGVACYVIESAPKDASYQYSKMVSWIEKESKVSRKIDLYDRKGALVKTLEVLKTEAIQGRLTPTVTKMSTVSEGTSTTINVEIMKYDDKIPDGVFTTDYLSTGKVKAN